MLSSESAMLSLFLRKGTPDPTIVPDIGDRDDGTGTGSRIRCPRCSWEPRPFDRWACSCLHAWNTFETGGVCPACDRRWVETQCLQCLQWSPHQDWYVEDPETP
jgi:hypothetical protein